jgi:hypothetical protein
VDSANSRLPITLPGRIMIKATIKKIATAHKLGRFHFLLSRSYKGLKMLAITAAQKIGEKNGVRRYRNRRETRINAVKKRIFWIFGVCMEIPFTK